MVYFDISAEAQNLLKLLYALYMSRRAEGKGRVESNYFANCEEIQKSYLKNTRVDDVIDLCRELKKNGCITYRTLDNIPSDISLTHEAIVYGEQTFKRNVSELLGWIDKIKGALPFLPEDKSV